LRRKVGEIVHFVFRPPAGPAASLLDLPWPVPLAHWSDDRLAHPYRAPGRRTVRFVSDGGRLYALKELPEPDARAEYVALSRLGAARLPAVLAEGVAVHRGPGLDAILVTRYQPGGVPLRALLSLGGPGQPGRFGARPIPPGELLDSLATLLARLHTAGIDWPGCGLSSALAQRTPRGLVSCVLTAGRGLARHCGGLGAEARREAVRRAMNVAGVELLDLEHRGQLRAGIDPVALASEFPRRYERAAEPRSLVKTR
jgi:hypothetical protein